MRLQSSGFANREVTWIRVRCIEQCRSDKAIKVAYLKHEFWLPLSWCRKIELGEDGYTRIVMPDWLLNKKVGEAMFQKARRATKRQQDLRLLEKDMLDPRAIR